MKITEFNVPEPEPIPEPTFEEELRAEYEEFSKPKVVKEAAPVIPEVDELAEQFAREFNEGVGIIVKGVNTTADVDENSTKREAAKLGLTVDKGGIPPLLRTNGKSKTHTNVMESPTADLKNLARAAAKKYSAGTGSNKNPHPADSYHGKIWQQSFNKAKAKLPKPIEEDTLTEARGSSLILVDFQPAYQSDDFGYDEAIDNAVAYINNKRPEVTCFYNGEDVGIEDTAEEVFWHYVEHGLDEDLQYLFTFKEKAYAWLRQWMDEGVDDAITIKVIRYLVMNHLNDSREIEDEEWLALVGEDFDYYDDREMNIYLPDISIGTLQTLSGSLLGGGGQHECLKEMQLLMNAFNIKYKMVGDWIYGG